MWIALKGEDFVCQRREALECAFAALAHIVLASPDARDGAVCPWCRVERRQHADCGAEEPVFHVACAHTHYFELEQMGCALEDGDGCCDEGAIEQLAGEDGKVELRTGWCEAAFADEVDAAVCQRWRFHVGDVNVRVGEVRVVSHRCKCCGL